jgi:hypothetical protein
MRSGLALTLLMFVVGSPFNLIVNLNADPATYPFDWELLPGSFKAGTVKEIGYRFWWFLYLYGSENYSFMEVEATLKTGFIGWPFWLHPFCLVGRISMPDWEILPRLLEIMHWLWH